MSIYTARLPTPLFNTPHIPFCSLPLKKDSQLLMRDIETIALPTTKFKSLREVSDFILEVETHDYPSSTPLYADRRFLQTAPPEISEREKKPPSAILEWLESCIGIRYFWGGNWREGIPEMLDLYPILKKALPEDQNDALCRGLDCSGLLYEATDGITPRNTSQLIDWGQNLPLQDLSPLEIQEQLQPLDLIVWKGHMLIVFSQELLIESRRGDGVMISPFEKRYQEIVSLTKAENKTLHFRRWSKLLEGADFR